jgi:hypothetical protein
MRRGREMRVFKVLKHHHQGSSGTALVARFVIDLLDIGYVIRCRSRNYTMMPKMRFCVATAAAVPHTL